jgi:hypothetical protein
VTLPLALVCVAIITAGCFCFWAHLRTQERKERLDAAAELSAIRASLQAAQAELAEQAKALDILARQKVDVAETQARLLRLEALNGLQSAGILGMAG